MSARSAVRPRGAREHEGEHPPPHPPPAAPTHRRPGGRAAGQPDNQLASCVARPHESDESPVEQANFACGHVLLDVLLAFVSTRPRFWCL